MSRPEFPGIILPVSCIQRIREDQNYYDENPERYEREERQRKERKDEEEQELYWQAIREEVCNEHIKSSIILNQDDEWQGGNDE